MRKSIHFACMFAYLAQPVEADPNPLLTPNDVLPKRPMQLSQADMDALGVAEKSLCGPTQGLAGKIDDPVNVPQRKWQFRCGWRLDR